MILRCKEGDIAVVEHDDPPCLEIKVEHADAYLRPIRKTGFNSLADIIELTQKPSESLQENLRESLKDLLP